MDLNSRLRGEKVWKIVKRLAAILCEPRYQMWDIYILYVDCLDPEGHYINFSKGLFRFVSFTYLTYVRCTSTFSNIMLDCRELLIVIPPASNGVYTQFNSHAQRALFIQSLLKSKNGHMLPTGQRYA